MEGHCLRDGPSLTRPGPFEQQQQVLLSFPENVTQFLGLWMKQSLMAESMKKPYIYSFVSFLFSGCTTKASYFWKILMDIICSTILEDTSGLKSKPRYAAPPKN